MCEKPITASEPMLCTLRSTRHTTPTNVVAALFLLLLSAAPATAAAHKRKVPCKQIKEAVLAGKTIAEITAEFQVDEQQVLKCTQGKSKHRKSKSGGTAKPKHAASSAQPASGSATKPPAAR